MAKIIENETFYYIERTIGNYVDYLDEEEYSYSYPNEYHSFATREKAQKTIDRMNKNGSSGNLRVVKVTEQVKITYR